MLQITINGSDISSHLVSYTREQDLCSSEGIIEFTLDSYSNINPYAVIRAYEDSNLKGTFYTDFTEKMSDGTMSVHGRDNSKRANDYYIAEQFTAEGDTTSRYWIEFFLGMAGISYNFTTTETGYTIQEGEVMGLTSCAEVVEMLVRYSAWYIYYDASNVAQIGKLDYDSSNYQKAFTDDDIISINYIKNDQYLRNRAVVWGAGYTGDQEWVFADISVTTPWDYDSLDKRAILARAGFPVPFSQAIATANVLLNEYARLVEEKTIAVHGFHNLEIGDFVLIQSQYYNGICLISAINVSTTDSGGYVTNLILDRRCPRFVGFYDVGGIVYAGTDGDGIWTKPLKTTHTWTDYSAGLSDLYIKDLDVSYGVMSTVTATGYLYGRTVGDAAWIRLQPSYYYDTIGSGYYPASSGIYVASTVKDLDQSLYGVFTVSGSDPRTWITRYPAVGGTPTNIFVTLSGENKYEGIDIEANYEDLYVSVVERGSNILMPFAYPTKGQKISFLSGTELDTKISEAYGTVYSGHRFYSVTGNYIYRYDFNTENLKKINYRLNSVENINISIGTEELLYYIPTDENNGHFFTYGYSPNLFVKCYKVSWESLSVTNTFTDSYNSDYYFNGMLGTVDDGGVIRFLFSVEASVDYLLVSVFDCETNIFSRVQVAEDEGEEHHSGSIWIGVAFPRNYADCGDGIFAFVAHGNLDNMIVYINTRTMEKVDILVPYTNNYELYGIVKVAPDYDTKDVYMFAYNYKGTEGGTLSILKALISGSYETVVDFHEDLEDEDFNFELCYNDSDVIAVWSSSDDLLLKFYDCKNEQSLGTKQIYPYGIYSKFLSENSKIYEFNQQSPYIDLMNLYDYTVVQNGDVGTHGTDLYQATVGGRLCDIIEYHPDISEYTEDELVIQTTIPGYYGGIQFFDEEDGLSNFSMYMITTSGYFVSNNMNPDNMIYSNYLRVTNLPYQSYYPYLGVDKPITQGETVAGKQGLLENIEEEDWDLSINTDSAITHYLYYSSGWYYNFAYTRGNDTTNAAEFFTWLYPTRRISLFNGDASYWQADNEGEMEAFIYKYSHEGRVEMHVEVNLTDSYVTDYIKFRGSFYRMPKTTPDPIDSYLIKASLIINGVRYESTEYDSVNGIGTISFSSPITINSISLVFTPLSWWTFMRLYNPSITIYPVGIREYSIHEIDPVSASFSLFKDDSALFEEDYWFDSIQYLLTIGKYIEYGYDDEWYQTYPSFGPTVMHTADDTGGSMGRILRYRNNEFESVYALAGAHFNLDISNPSVIAAYTGVSTSGTIFIDGEPYSTGSSRGDIFFSFAGDYGHFRHINLPTMSGSYIYDTRGFTIVDENDEFRTCIGMVMLSGLYGSVGQFSYIDVTEYEDIGGVITFPDIHTVESFDYVPVALETSNYNHYSTPYFLVGLSGTSTPFLQRDIDTEDFINRSDNFPTSKITTIRLDDMI